MILTNKEDFKLRKELTDNYKQMTWKEVWAFLKNPKRRQNEE